MSVPAWIDLNGLPCTIFMVVAAILLFVKMRDRTARVAWSILLAVSMIHGITISLLPDNWPGRGIVHYYIGAKYNFPYRAFYTLTSAATDRPQIVMHDLDHPPKIIRDSPSEQRAYFIDLLRSEHIDFDPTVSLPELRKLAEESGAVHREAEGILKANLPPDQIESFRRDVKAALIDKNPARDIEGIGNDIALDFGYNGSPFYSLVRHLDPTLYLPFGTGTAAVNLVWQLMALAASIWLMGIALGLGTTDRIAVGALFFASWDYVAWNLPGLSFAGFWLPIAVALWAVSRNRPVIGGAAVAWAGLIKLFPYALLLLPGVEMIRSLWRRLRRATARPEWKWSVTFVAATVAATLVLGGISELAGRSWVDFMGKILAQFSSEDYVGGNVSIGQVLIALGIFKSPITIVLRLIGLAAFVWFLWNTDSTESRPRLFLIVLAAMPWFVSFWFNYYTMAPLVLLPLIAKSNRLGAAMCAAGLALVFLLPEFASPIVLDNRFLWIIKVVPYLAIPGWLVFVEFRPLFARKAVQRWAIVLAAFAIVLVGGEAARQSMIRRYDAEGGRYLDQGQMQAALGSYNSLLGIAPRNAMAQMSKGICLAGMRQYDEAEASFRRATELAPDQSSTFLNLAHLLLMRGKLADARAAIEKAMALSPYDDAIWVEQARITAALGDRARAKEMVSRALELNPQNREAQALLRAAP
ncbi:hypothetical protein C3F09_07705 [candidate division GN15 bacterium]|uniref:Tetratricopeptide repeat protein n=1 Tax=candidate division GN15 bacterium TaxID=2072418 RepID=A0A855X206_9BACT|nr:MAG: hypothetical protein C3F09_07705 [candidate division GN15 bacterium]